MNPREIKKMLIKEGFRPSIKHGQILVKIEGKLYIVSPMPGNDDCLSFFIIQVFSDTKEVPDEWAITECVRITHKFIIGKCLPSGRTEEKELVFRYSIEVCTDVEGFRKNLDEYVSILQAMIDQTSDDLYSGLEEEEMEVQDGEIMQ